MKIFQNIDQAHFESLILNFESKKRNVIRSMKSSHARMAAATSALLIRYVIDVKLGLDREGIAFVENEFGKPRLMGEKDFHFNLSKSIDWVVCVIDCEPVGIDIEKIDYKHPKIILEALSKSEIEVYEKLDPGNKVSFFYKIWTRKESYLKALGVGLNVALNTLTAHVENENGIFSPNVENKIDDKYFLKQYSIDSDYAMSVCAMNKNFNENVIFVDNNDLIKNIAI